ncbi:MAG: hypothetical protein ABH844_05570 [Candidatus Omnitrophota bacterium]
MKTDASKIAVTNAALSFFTKYRARAELNKITKRVSPILPVYQISGAEAGNKIPISKALVTSDLKFNTYSKKIQTMEGINIAKYVFLSHLMNLLVIIRKDEMKIVTTATAAT